MFKEDELRGFLSRYDEALQVRSEAHRTSNDLVNQDRWYRSKLRDALKTRRAEKDGAYMTKGEMVKLMQWKLARGKWRPSLEAYVAAHEERDIRGATKDLFAAIDKESEKSSKEPVSRQILKKITCLKGIGPATASAILAAYEPTRFPFLSDEAFVGVGKLGIKAEHTEAALDRFHARMHERVAAEGWSDVDELERACYAAGVIKKYGAASEGQEGREKGKKKDAEELIESVKHSATAEQRTAKYARPDAATAHGGDEVPTDSAGNKESASSSKGKGRAQKEKQETKKEQAEESNKPSSSSKKRKTTDDSKATQGERKSARLASK